MTEEGGQTKRKHVTEKEILIFVNGDTGGRCAAIFGFKVEIKSSTRAVSVIGSETAVIEPFKCFYKTRYFPKLRSVSACVSNSKLYVIPDDAEPMMFYNRVTKEDDDDDEVFKPREIIPMCTFDLQTKTPTEEITITTRKWDPFLASIGNTVYALSGPNSHLVRVLDPCFESLRLDDDDHKWSPLPCAPFHSRKDTPKICYYIDGYAVLENEGLILVCLVHNYTDVQFFSYNTHSNRWKPVLLPAPLPDDYAPPGHHESKLPRLHGQSSAIIGNDIYTYNHASFALRVFSYTKLAGGGSDLTSPDLSLGQSSFVQGMGCLDRREECDEDANYEACEVSFDRSSAVAKVDGDDILCVLHTLYPSCSELLSVCVNIIQLEQRDQCFILKKFTCFLSVDKLVCPTIKTCFVENLDETNDYPSLKKAVMSNAVDDEASEMVSGDSMIQ